MYETILSLFVTALGAVEGTVLFTTLEILATCCCVFVLIIPFIIVFWVIRFIVGCCRL